MTHIRRFDHVGITPSRTSTGPRPSSSALGLEVEGRMLMEGEFVDTVIGIPTRRLLRALHRCGR